MEEIISGDYIAGFVEGEGCFSVNLNHNKNGKINSYRPMFSLGLNIRDESLLKKIQQEIGCGSIYYDKSPRKRGYDKTHDIVVLKIYRKTDIYYKLIPFFEKHKFHGSKKSTFDNFKEIVQIIGTKHYKSDEEKKRILELKNQLNPIGK